MNDDINELMHSYQNGEVHALDRLYTLLKPTLYLFIYRYTKNEQLSMDIVQDAFLQLQQKKNQFDSNKANVKTYLFQIGYNIMVNKLNRRKRLQKLLPFLTPTSFEIPNNDEKLEIKEAIMGLQESQRAVIILKYYHDMTNAEIADILSIPIGTVKSRLHMAIKNLKQLLGVDDFEDKRSV
ncbi:RNA polymerase sigma-70 factor (ECF subfamily) [Bacillus mesophilus]|uniref:RNA polymerase sigma factor n=1 Tax=Bacillus mesophilus TaxID=1808955 RepID=A0A6M0Q6W0_9BACI|nr:RNA polymerase sigma factor [Bacillus mesophilus]MBM7660969.1 RNA polymerase sigma-70 factor (ECF subfamily) [Bacillus mesophilus]NEY71489.1 RNA polymerase sigma factor [Bacillus mesophilus]